jgi:hypothetical protein
MTPNMSPSARAVSGLASGAAATLPMTLAMLALRARIPREGFKTLPPRKITLNLLHRLGLARGLDRKDKRRLVGLSHFGYGAAAGALYGLIGFLPRRLPGPLYGLAVWAVSYLGAMPALSLYRRADRDPASRNKLMILSHVVWGVFLGMGFAAIRTIRHRYRNRV